MTIDQTPPSAQDTRLLEEVGATPEGFRYLLDLALERGYLERLSSASNFPRPDAVARTAAWIHLQRLPVHPTKVEEYDLLSRWQNVLGTLHAWDHRLAFLLVRHDGKTHIYLGAASRRGLVDRRTATGQLRQATLSQMPGIDLKPLDEEMVKEQIVFPTMGLQESGAVTGLPSPRKARDSGLLQTLDQIAFGIRDQWAEHDYALLVMADPVSDPEISDAIHALRVLGSQIHGGVKRSVAEGKHESESSKSGVRWGTMAGTVLSPILSSFLPGSGALAGGIFAGFDSDRSRSEGSTHTVSSEELDKVAEYCEKVTDHHVDRLQKGRNLGFWSTGVYVLAETETDVRTLTGMLRSIYSGEESYLEPIRVHLFRSSSGVDGWIKRIQRVPLPKELTGGDDQSGAGRDGGWHAAGSMYEGVVTPLNTEELSLTTSLPRRDVPGLRFVRNAVRFANNPPRLEDGADAITLGHVLDTGVRLDLEYGFDVNTLVRHTLVTGVTGSGKTTTCKRLIKEVMSRNLPVLVIEPAKDEYVAWAVEHNKEAPEEQRIGIYVPGANELDGAEISPLRLNPFQPAQLGGKVDMASRAERFSAVLTASLPMADVLPLLLEESINEFLYNQIPHFEEGVVSAPERYPRLEDVKPIAEALIRGRGYEERVQDNLVAAVKTRIDALCRGRRGQVLNAGFSTDYSELFERPAVVNLSQITDDRDKALIMALLVTALYEYRVSKYRTDPGYKQRAQSNNLCHLTVIEEAHRLLSHPQSDYAGIGNPQAVVSGMFSEMLSEIRAYGQGLMIVDQVPARLIPDAIKNTNLKIVHRLVARDDRDAMASCMALRLDQEDIIAALQQGEAVVCGDLDDAASWVKVEKQPD